MRDTQCERACNWGCQHRGVNTRSQNSLVISLRCPLKSSNITKHLQSNYVCFFFFPPPIFTHFLRPQPLVYDTSCELRGKSRQPPERRESALMRPHGEKQTRGREADVCWQLVCPPLFGSLGKRYPCSPLAPLPLHVSLELEVDLQAAGELEPGPRPITRSNLSTKPHQGAPSRFKEHPNAPGSSTKTTGGVLSVFKLDQGNLRLNKKSSCRATGSLWPCLTSW